MRIHGVIAFALVGLIFAPTLMAQEERNAAGADHVILTPGVKWTSFPSLGPGIQIAVLSGDPYKPGSPYVCRILSQRCPGKLSWT